MFNYFNESLFKLDSLKSFELQLWFFWQKAIAMSTSCSESSKLLLWYVGNTASGQGLPKEQSSVTCRPSEFFFLDVRRTAREQVRTCGFRRNWSRIDKAPKMRDYVQLNSLKCFLVILPSISSETWEMYSWAIPGSSVFCDRLFLVFSGVSLETAAHFLLFLKFAMILREKVLSVVKIELDFYFKKKANVFSYYEGKVSIKAKTWRFKEN